MVQNIRYFIRGAIETATVLFILWELGHKLLTFVTMYGPRRGRRY